MGKLIMKYWVMLANGSAADVHDYINSIFDVLLEVEVIRARRFDCEWATLLEFDVCLRHSTNQYREHIEIAEGNAVFSGWFRNRTDGTLHSSIRQKNVTPVITEKPILGEFSYAAILPDKALVMTDYYSTHPVYYWRNQSGQWVLGNDLRLVLRCDLVPLKIRYESCFEALTHSMMVGENELPHGVTFFDSVYKMRENSTLFIERCGKKYNFEFGNLADVNLDLRLSCREDCELAFRACFDACVRDRIDAGASGILLSGGIDSTVVLGACLSANTKPYCINMAFRDPDLAMSQDEKLIEILTRQCDVPHQILFADKFLRIPTHDDVGAFIDGPDTSANPLAKEACAEAFQKYGTSLVMTGEGGDVILGESTHSWILDSIRRHDGFKALHRYVTNNLGIRTLSEAYFRQIAIALSIRYGRRKLFKEGLPNEVALLPKYFSDELRNKSGRTINHQDGYSRFSTRHLGQDYVLKMLFPRAAYFDGLNTYCVCSHPFLDPRMVSFALTCPPHMHHDYLHLQLSNPYATSKILARESYRALLPTCAIDKITKTSYALMARKMFSNSARHLLNLTDNPMILHDHGLINQKLYRRHLIAYIAATEDPNVRLGANYHYLRGVADLEIWLQSFSGSRNSMNRRLKLRPLRSFEH